MSETGHNPVQFKRAAGLRLELSGFRTSPMHESHDANVRRLRTLRAEIDTASAMMSLVKYTREPELIRKYKEVALRSFLSALDLVAISTLTPEEDQEIWEQLAPIRQWLEAEHSLGM
jgi:hypothetical protein